MRLERGEILEYPDKDGVRLEHEVVALVVNSIPTRIFEFQIAPQLLHPLLFDSV